MSQNTIKKVQEAISTLDDNQLDKVLDYIKELNQDGLLNQRAQVSEEAIKYGKVLTFDKFNRDFEAWKRKKSGLN